MKYVIVLAWIWLIIIGGLMITPRGIECIVCGAVLTRIIGVVTVILGVSLFAINQRVVQR